MHRFLGWAVVLALSGVATAAQTALLPEPARQAALTLQQQGHVVEAEQAWQALRKAHPAAPEPWAQIGLLEARQEHYSAAVPYYRKALALNPRVAGLRLNLALALFKAGEFRQAIPQFQVLLKSAAPGSPDLQRATVLLGMCHYGLSEYAQAAPYLLQAVDRDPQNLQLLFTLAHTYLWSSQYQKVLDVYRRILVLNPDSAQADMLAGEALDELKDHNGAIQQFRAAVAANPKEPNVHFGLGYLLWTQHQYPEAIQELQAELAGDPGHLQSMLYLGDAYMQVNRPADAVPLLQKVLSLDNSLTLAHLDLGIIAANAGRNDDALREFLSAEKLDPKEVNVHWRLGRLYRSLGRKDEARAEFDKASTLNKAADEELFKKMGNSNAKPPVEVPPPASQAAQTPPGA